MQASGGKSAAAARFPVRDWEGGKPRSVLSGAEKAGADKVDPAPKGHRSLGFASMTVGNERVTSLHLPVRDRGLGPRLGSTPEKTDTGRWIKKKKLSKRQLANAARARL